MKKLLIAVLTLSVICALFVGCSQNNSTNTPATTRPDQTESTSQTKPEAPTPNLPTNDPENITGLDSAGISEIPDSFIGYSMPTTCYISGQVGSKPGDVVKTTESADYYCTISYPIIPDSLREFADNRGDNYLLLYVESKTDNRSGAILVFYGERVNLIYGEQEGNFTTYSSNCYVFTSHNGAFWPDTISNGGIIYADSKTEAVPYTEIDDGVILDPYTNSSMSPSQQHIDLMIGALQ